MRHRKAADDAAGQATNEQLRREQQSRDNAARDEEDLSAPSPDAGPDSPAELKGKGLVGALKRTVKEFSEDNVTDWAAALTYYGVLSIFPGLLMLMSLLGLL